MPLPPLSIIALRDRPCEKHDSYIVFLLEYLGGTLQGEAAEVCNLGFFTLEECEKLPIAQLSLSVISPFVSATRGLIKSSLSLNKGADCFFPYSLPP